MALYKIMIVDDEVEVREGIVNKIDWHTLGFDIVAQAENGEDALEKAESLDLDVVLTDIKMPFMDGLTLGARLHELYPAIKLILFSGFDKFEYAQEAIKLDVVEYVLKPINAQELTDVLRRVRRTMDEELARKRDAERLRTIVHDNLPVMRENFLGALLRGTLPREAVMQGVLFYNIDIEPEQDKTVCVFDIRTAEDRLPTLSDELLAVSVKNVADSTFAGICSAASLIGRQHVVVITSWAGGDAIPQAMRAANSVCAECRRTLGLTVTAGVGQSCTEITSLVDSYEQALLALEYRGIVGSGRAIYIRDMELIDRGGVYHTLDSRIEETILSAVRFGDQQQLDETTALITRRLTDEKQPLWQRRAFAHSVLSAISHIAQIQDIQDPDTLSTEALANLGEQTPPALLTRSLTGVFSHLSDHLNRKRMTAAKNLVESAKAYIFENYGNADLSVDMLCEHLHISQSYFSTIFKQETGQSYVAYLTDVRLSQAAQLLEESDEKTYIIARQIGYEDPNYFSYVFKKKKGVSPSAYRQQQRGGV